MRNIYKLFLLVALAIWASGASAQTSSVCAGSALPANWVHTGTTTDYTRCNSPLTPQNDNIWIIQNTAGQSSLGVCAGSVLPAGWVVTNTLTNYSNCQPEYSGALVPQMNNMWNIVSVSGKSVVTACSQFGSVPAGWRVTQYSSNPTMCLLETGNPVPQNPTNNVEIITGPPPTPTTPPATVIVSYSQSPQVVGQPYTMTWHTTNATSLFFTCYRNGVMTVNNQSWPLNGSSSYISTAVLLGSTTCNWIANGPGGQGEETITTTVVPAKPTINLAITPNPMVAGQPYTEVFGATNATSLTYNCTSTGTGWTANNNAATINGTYTATASSAWVGYPTNCVWTATGPGGTTTYNNTYVTVNPPPKPAINITISPNPMVVGQPYTEFFGATNATSMTYNCTSTGTGWIANNNTVTINSSYTGTGNAAWVGYPTNCVWTAVGPGGTTTYDNTYVTVK